MKAKPPKVIESLASRVVVFACVFEASEINNLKSMLGLAQPIQRFYYHHVPKI